MNKKITMIVMGLLLLVAGTLIIRNILSDDLIVLDDATPHVLSYQYTKDFDFKFEHLLDPFTEYNPTLLEETLTFTLASHLNQDYVVWIDVNAIKIGDESVNQLFDIHVVCGEHTQKDLCILSPGDASKVSITVDFQTYLLDELRFDIATLGVSFNIVAVLYPKDALHETLQSKYQTDEDLLRIYTEFGHDPSREMVINYHANHGPIGVVEYRLLGNDTWEKSLSESTFFPFRDESIYRVSLKDLNPDSTYEFRTHDNGRIYRFKTMPLTLDREIKIVFTGDSRSFNDWFYDLNDVIFDQTPDLVVGTGDYVACEGIISEFNSNLWVHFLDALNDAWIDSNGLIIPFMPGFGNHEADSGWSGSLYRDKAYLPMLFSFPNQDDYPRENEGYGYIQFGDYFTLILLDSYHTNDIEPQTAWLETMKAEFSNTTHIIPVYHSAVFPSRKPFNVSYKNDIRHQWLPIFQELGVRVVMESCDHTYKKTFPIWFDQDNPDGFIHEDGMIFLGDGGWGAPLRTVLLENEGQFDKDHLSEVHWWIESAAGLDYNIDDSKHIHMVTLRPNSLFVESINYLGTVFDAFEMTLRP